MNRITKGTLFFAGAVAILWALFAIGTLIGMYIAFMGINS
jgi:hypothetical protein